MARRIPGFVLRDTVRRSLMVAAALQATFAAGSLHALPTGGQVVIPGSAQIGVPANSALTVTNQPGAIINWQSFSIAPNELVKFVQQGATSAVLNRVTGAQMSEIMGRLQSNGRVFLVNPNGIIVGPGAVVDTAGFIASTLPMLDRDFLDGRLRFQGDAQSNGRIVNQGAIRAGFGGQVLLVSPHIENSGLIEAPGGEILLAAGKSVTVTPLNASGVSFELQAPTDSVLNIGRLIADGGAVGAFAGTLRHSGEIRANAMVRDQAGRIVLQGAGDTLVAAGSSTRADGRIGGSIRVESGASTRVEGQLSAVGSAGHGGRIEVLGEKVLLTGSAALDVSGAAGGGTLLAGGDWQGANPEVRNAASTFVGTGASLAADATVAGDGGTIVVWADRDTRFLGRLSARGGPQGGDGGRAEVSGKGDLLFIGGADLSAPRGAFGSLLLDPLDLFIDTVGGLNPFIIDEPTDFPDNAVTVSPATLAAIAGHVTLFATRDMRFNSSVTLTGPGQSLSAQAGRDIQLGATLATDNGAVSLSAGRSITTFGSPSIAAGTGAVTAASAGGSLALGSVASAGSVTVSSTGGSLSTSGITATGPVGLASNGGSLSTGNIASTGSITASSSAAISTGTLASGGGAVTLSTPSAISTGAVTSAGGALNATSKNSSVFVASFSGGGGSAGLSGTSVFTGVLDTTGNVSLNASAGTISASVDNAASVKAAASRSFSSTSINLSSSTVLNATSVTATATGCAFSSSCPGASITLSGAQGVNVGNVVATAPATTHVAVPFNSISESVSVSAAAGPILAMGPGSRVTATDVTLSTNQSSGGGIGTPAQPLQVDVERNFVFRPNGDFAVQLLGSGPNRLTFSPGVAATGQSYAGTLSGLVNASVSASEATVTVQSFAATSGFSDLVFNQSPLIALSTPNGDLVVDSMTAPAGDQSGRNQPFFPFSNVIQGLPVSVSASGALTVTAYARTAGASAKSTGFTASGGALSLGSISGDRDTISASGRDSVTIGNLSTAGNVTVSSTPNATAAGNVTIDRISSASGSVTVTAIDGTVAAMNDGAATEITAGGAIALTAASIGSSGFGNPLDVAGNTVSLTANGSTAGSGFIGSGASPVNPVVASTAELTVDATRQFNVDTGALPLVNLTVVASPSGVTGAGIAQVRSDGTPFAFAGDGTDFTLENWTATSQFNGGTLDFASTTGNIDFGSIDFSATNGSLALRARQQTSGDVTRLAGAVDLGSGVLTVRADRDVSLGDLVVGGLSVANSNSGFFPGQGACSTVGSSTVCATQSLAIGNIIGPGNGAFSATTRFGITAGDIDGVGTISFNASSNGITLGDIGSAATAAGSVDLRADLATAGGNISTGTIEAGSLTASAIGSVSTAAINGTAAGGSASVALVATGAVSTGSVNAGVAAPGSVSLRSNTSITTGTIEGSSVFVSQYFGGATPSLNLGAIGGSVPGIAVALQGGTVTTGAITLDTGLAGEVSIIAAGALTLGGAILAGDGTFALVSAANTGALSFSRIDTGATGQVSLSNAAGILQTAAAAADGGIRAGSVTLSARGASGSLLGPGADNSRITLRGASSLTLNAGADIRLNLVDTAGSAPGPELVNLDITRGRNDSSFVLDGLPGTQTLTLADTGSGTQIALDSAGSAAPLHFRYRNDDAAGTIEVSTAQTRGGTLRLSTATGDIQVAAIDTRGGVLGDGAITLETSGGHIRVTAVVEAGSADITARATGASRDVLRSAAAGEFRSSGTVTLQATRELGRSGVAERFKVTGAPTVSLDGSEIHADLIGTTHLIAAAGDDFDVSSTADLTVLDLSLAGAGSGPTSLVTATQSFGLSRAAGKLDIATVASATPMAAFRARTSSGDLRVVGSDASAISADELRLQSAGALTLDGTSSGVVLANASQTFIAAGELKVEGVATLTASGAQSFSTSGGSDIVLAAAGGSIAATAASQSLLAGGSVVLQGGSGAGDSVTLGTTGTFQILSGNTGVNLLGGSGALSGITVTSGGSGQQTLQSFGNLVLTGGGTAGGNEASTIMVAQSGAGGQRLQASGSLLFTGGIGADGAVQVSNNGTGAQNIGDPFPCCNSYSTQTVTLQGGDGARSSVEIRSSDGQQLVQPYVALNVLGGDGSDAFARVATTSANEQRIGGPNYFCCSVNPVNTIALTAGSGNNAFAEITATGFQRVTAATSMVLGGSSAAGGHALLRGAGQDVRTASTSLLAGSGSGADAQIVSTGSALQYVDPTSLTLTAGGTAATSSASARIVSGGSQQFGFAGSTVLTGGTGPSSMAEITSVSSQDLSFGSLTLSGGIGSGTHARIVGGSSQRVSSSTTTLTGGTGTAGAGNDASAMISNLAGSQTVNTGNLTLRSGADHAVASIVNHGTRQQVTSGNLQITTSSGANSLDTPIAGKHHAAIAQIGSDSQTVSASSITIDNAHAPGGIGIVNRGSSQAVSTASSLNVLASGSSGIATIDSTAGTQTIIASGGIVVRAAGGSGLAQIANAAGDQTFTASSGGVRIQATGGSGSAKITAAGDQSFTAVQFLDVSTAASATGNAELSATGDQSIHTTNGLAAGYSLKVAALGTGRAKIEAGGDQLIEADYPELMGTSARDGRIYIGDPAGLGAALIRGVQQDIFARALIIQGGASAASTAKLDASGNQTISILTPSAIPAGITVAGGAGGSASLDPLIQTIVSAGPIRVFGGSGLDAFGLISSSGPQVILVTAPDRADSLLLEGGSGTNAYAAITTPDPQMRLGTSGGITLIGGSGRNADAVFGNGPSNSVAIACGSSFTCTFANLIGDPFINAITDVGIANNGLYVPLNSIIAVGSSSQSGPLLLPFDFNNLLLALRGPSDRTLEGDAEQELRVVVLGRRLPVCR